MTTHSGHHPLSPARSLLENRTCAEPNTPRTQRQQRSMDSPPRRPGLTDAPRYGVRWQIELLAALAHPLVPLTWPGLPASPPDHSTHRHHCSTLAPRTSLSHNRLSTTLVALSPEGSRTEPLTGLLHHAELVPAHQHRGALRAPAVFQNPPLGSNRVVSEHSGPRQGEVADSPLRQW